MDLKKIFRTNPINLSIILLLFSILLHAKHVYRIKMLFLSTHCCKKVIIILRWMELSCSLAVPKAGLKRLWGAWCLTLSKKGPVQIIVGPNTTVSDEEYSSASPQERMMDSTVRTKWISLWSGISVFCLHNFPRRTLFTLKLMLSNLHNSTKTSKKNHSNKQNHNNSPKNYTLASGEWNLCKICDTEFFPLPRK